VHHGEEDWSQPSGGMLLCGFVMATFDKFVIFKRVNTSNTFRASTKLVEREQGEALEIERKKGPKFNDTVGHASQPEI
jgi:hypothetical protein